MKLLILFIVCVLSALSINAQTCIVGNVTFNSQADVDAFVATYAGSGCTIIDGRLTIGNVNNLSGLTFLNEVTDDIRSLFSNGSLTSLNGLQNIQTIGDDLVIQAPNLTEVNFPNLTSVVEIRIFNNNVLEAIRFNSLATIPDQIDVRDNPTLNTLEFNSLVNCGGQFRIFGNGILNTVSIPILEDVFRLVVGGNNFIDLTDFANITIISTLNINNADSLISLQGLENISEITIDLFIEQNDNLVDISALSNLSSVNNDLIISGNNSLPNLDGLDNLNYVGGNVDVNNNPLLDDCCVLINFLDGNAFCEGTISAINNNTNCNTFRTIIPYCEATQLDEDNDGIFNPEDNCIDNSNTNQIDTDSDGIGDVCDNCPSLANNAQLDANNNGIGDACENDMTINSGNDGGGVGINTTNPTSALEITGGDVFLSNSYRGIIMKASNGKCFRYKPNNDGSLSAKEITCPDN